MGLGNGKLALATATESCVLEGLTFYAGDKKQKTGTIQSMEGSSANVSPGDTYTFPTQGKHCAGNMTISVNGVSYKYKASYSGYGTISYTATAGDLVCVVMKYRFTVTGGKEILASHRSHSYTHPTQGVWGSVYMGLYSANGGTFSASADVNGCLLVMKRA